MSLIGSSSAIESVRNSIEQVTDTSATVLLLGETGTGKEVVARQIHLQSRRARGPFIAANCGGLAPTLVASDFFGHEVGAFTGAVRRRAGRFEQANGGTLFLDEVGELPIEIQPLLLRVLEERTIEPVGGSSMGIDVRIVAATNRSLASEVQASNFRADLFYRLNVFPIALPPLREHSEDIPELAHHFLRHYAAVHSRPANTISAKALQLLIKHEWPGNVRELRNVIERGVIASRTEEVSIEEAWLVETLLPPAQIENARTWAIQEKARIMEALQATGGRIYGPGGAAHRLGLRPTTLYGKMRKHGITKRASNWE